MKKFLTDEEINKLKKITDKVFLVLNKPQLSLVKRMKSIPCTIMRTGMRGINMDYFYCQTCDKEHKFPICKKCAERCHKGHIIPAYIPGSDDHPVVCMCGVKNHNMSKKKKIIGNEVNIVKCCFNNLSLLSEQYEYFVGINGKKVCVFCYHFCCHNLLTNEDDDESRLKAFRFYQFRKVKCTKEEFEKGIQNGKINCDCLSLPDSKHKSQDYLSVFITDLNIPYNNEEDNDDYYSNLTPTHILNYFFVNIDLFESIYSGFLNEYNEFNIHIYEKNVPATISTTFGIGYANFANNATNCKYNFYFNEQLNSFYTTEMTKGLLEKNIKLNEHNNTFLINYIKGYIKYRLGGYLESIPRFLITDEINMSPFQRKIIRDKSYKIFERSGLIKENLIDTVINSIDKIIGIRPELNDSIQIFIELFRIIKLYSRFYFIKKEEILNICNIMDSFFSYLSLFQSNIENEEITLKEERKKLLKTIIKIITYFTIYLNDETFNSFFNLESIYEEKENEKIFFQSYNEYSKAVNNIMIHVADFIRNEYEVVGILINKEKVEKKNSKKLTINSNQFDNNNNLNEEIDDEGEEMTNFEYQIALLRIIYIIQITLQLSLGENDVYLPTLKRCINSNLTNFIKIINNDLTGHYITMLEEKTDELEILYFDYFNESTINIDVLENFINTNIQEILLPLEHKFENILDKSNGIFTCECEYNYINVPIKSENNALNEHFMLNKSTILYSITKVFKLSKDKSIYSQELCENILRFCFAYICDNQDNCIMGLSTPILKNLSKIPRMYLCCILDYMIFGLKILIRYNAEVPFGFYLAKFGFLIYDKTTDESKRNNGKNLQNNPYCMVKLFKLLQLLFLLNGIDQHQFLDFIKPKLEEMLDSDLIQFYKFYLLNIAEDFKKNSKYYITKRNFNNNEIFQKYFKNYISLTQTFTSTLMFKIFYRFLKLLNKTFDVNALDDIPQFLKDYLTPNEILKILSITTLNIELRLEIIKFFRMIYIDLSIDITKIEQYRYIFQEELEAEAAQVGDSLIPLEQMKIFLFLKRLLKVSNYIYEPTSYEFDLIFFEVKNIKTIIMNSKKVDQQTYMNYIESGIILPIKIYLNKVFSMIISIKGKGMLNLYRFCYYILKMKEFVIESKIISNVVENDNNFESVFKNDEFNNEKTLLELKDDIKIITNTSFPILNYMEIYRLINKHIMSLIEEPTSQELLLYFSEYEQFEEKNKNNFKIELEKKGINFNKSVYKIIWKAYETYTDQKENFDKSSIKANFDNNFLNGEITTRSVLLRYLFFLCTNKVGSFSQESINMLLKLLKNETDEAQAAILALAEKNIKSNNQNKNAPSAKEKNEKKKKKNEKKKDGNNVDNEDKLKQIEDFYYLAKKGFDCILSSIFSQYNPTSLELSDDYYTACHIIKVFKFLCEDHNQKFQRRLMCEISFSVGNGISINFYDMMLFIIDKIITISLWEKAKDNEEIQDYFYGLFSCLIELLIEIIQGTDKNNFKVLYNQNTSTNEEENSDNNLVNKTVIDNKSDEKSTNTFLNINEIQYYENGKALKSFLNNIKNIMLDENSEDNTIFSVRKDLMNFILAFIEEYNCPKNIKNLIMSVYHPNLIIKSICNVLKKYYLSFITYNNKSRSIFIDEENFKRNRINMIIDQNLGEKNVQTTKSQKNKKLKRLKFNEDLYNQYITLYFEDPEFSKTKTFDLCYTFYKYFILTYIQYKNEETIDFWNKIHNITDEGLKSYNSRTIISNKLENLNGPVSDESDIEAYYIIKFFTEVSKHVLVKLKPEIPSIYVVYKIHPYSNFLSNDSKSEFLRTVDRKNRYTKLYDLIENSEYFKLEIVYNWNHLRQNKLLRQSIKINYHLLGYISFFISFILNIVLLVTLHESGENYYGNHTVLLIKIFSGIVCFFISIVIVYWFITKYNLYIEIEKAKFFAHHNDKQNVLTLKDKINIQYKVIISKGELTPLILVFIFLLLGICHKNMRFFFSFSLLSILFLSINLNNLILSILIKGKLLLLTSFFTMILLYIYAGWGFYYQRDRFYDTDGRDKPDNMCDSLLYCFLTMVNNGLRWHAGIGKVARPESGLLHFSSFVHRFFFDLLFFWIFSTLLKIIFGIILDSFGELRQAYDLIQNDISNNCFICNIEKDTYEKNNKDNKSLSFKEHCEIIHNVWDYIFYMIALRVEDPQELNAINSRNREKMLKKSVEWLPDSNLENLENNYKKDEED